MMVREDDGEGKGLSCALCNLGLVTRVFFLLPFFLRLLLTQNF